MDSNLNLLWAKTININNGQTYFQNLGLSSTGNLFIVTYATTPWTSTNTYYVNPGVQQISPTDGTTTWIQQFYNQWTNWYGAPQGISVYSNGFYFCSATYDYYATYSSGSNGYEIKIQSWSNAGSLLAVKEISDYGNNQMNSCGVSYQESTSLLIVAITYSASTTRLYQLNAGLTTYYSYYISAYLATYGHMNVFVTQTLTGMFYIFSDLESSGAYYRTMVTRLNNLSTLNWYGGCSSIMQAPNTYAISNNMAGLNNNTNTNWQSPVWYNITMISNIAFSRLMQNP